MIIIFNSVLNRVGKISLFSIYFKGMRIKDFSFYLQLFLLSGLCKLKCLVCTFLKNKFFSCCCFIKQGITICLSMYREKLKKFLIILSLSKLSYSKSSEKCFYLKYIFFSSRTEEKNCYCDIIFVFHFYFY